MMGMKETVSNIVTSQADKGGVKHVYYVACGAGSVSVRSDAGIKKAEKAGIIVVRASRTGNGVVPLDKGQPGLVSDSLNPAKARVLLMTALTQTHNPELIQSYFSTY